MPVSVRPSPGEGSLGVSGTPPSVVIELEVPRGGWFAATFVTSSGPIFLEKGLLRPGHNHIRIFLPQPLPPGTLTVFGSDVSGCSGLFQYAI